VAVFGRHFRYHYRRRSAPSFRDLPLALLEGPGPLGGGPLWVSPPVNFTISGWRGGGIHSVLYLRRWFRTWSGMRVHGEL